MRKQNNKLKLFLILVSLLWVASCAETADSSDDDTSLGATASIVVSEVQTNLQTSSSGGGLQPRISASLMGPSLAVSAVNTGLTAEQISQLKEKLESGLKSAGLTNETDLSKIHPVVMRSFQEALQLVVPDKTERAKAVNVAAYSMSTAVSKVKSTTGASITDTVRRKSFQGAAEKATGYLDEAGFTSGDIAARIKEINQYMAAGFKDAGFSAAEIQTATAGMAWGSVQGLNSLQGVSSTNFQALCEKVAEGAAAGLTNVSTVSGYDQTATLKKIAYGMAAGLVYVDSTRSGSPTATSLNNWVNTGIQAGDTGVTSAIDFSTDISSGTTDGNTEQSGGGGTTQLLVQSSTPKHLARAVNPDLSASPISLTFNVNVDSATVPTSLVSTSCADNIQISKDNFTSCVINVNVSVSGTVIEITGPVTLPDGNYKMKITTAVQGTGGETLSSEYLMDFSTRRVIFLSQNQYNGDLVTAANTAGGSPANGIEAADYLCNNDSFCHGSGGCKALIMGSTRTDTSAVLAGSTDYYRNDLTTAIGTTGTTPPIFAVSLATLTNSISTTASLKSWTAINVISDTSWGPTSGTCNDWSDSTNGVDGTAGIPDMADSTAFSGGLTTCDTPAHLYCVDQP